MASLTIRSEESRRTVERVRVGDKVTEISKNQALVKPQSNLVAVAIYALDLKVWWWCVFGLRLINNNCCCCFCCRMKWMDSLGRDTTRWWPNQRNIFSIFNGLQRLTVKDVPPRSIPYGTIATSTAITTLYRVCVTVNSWQEKFAQSSGSKLTWNNLWIKCDSFVVRVKYKIHPRPSISFSNYRKAGILVQKLTRILIWTSSIRVLELFLPGNWVFSSYYLHMNEWMNEWVLVPLRWWWWWRWRSRRGIFF